MALRRLRRWRRESWFSQKLHGPSMGVAHLPVGYVTHLVLNWSPKSYYQDFLILKPAISFTKKQTTIDRSRYPFNKHPSKGFDLCQQGVLGSLSLGLIHKCNLAVGELSPVMLSWRSCSWQNSSPIALAVAILYARPVSRSALGGEGCLSFVWVVDCNIVWSSHTP